MVEPNEWPAKVLIVPFGAKGVQSSQHTIKLKNVVFRHVPAGDYIIGVVSKGHKRYFKRITHDCSQTASSRRHLHFLKRTPKPIKSALIQLPFSNKQQRISYTLRNGRAIAMGDVDLGLEADLLAQNAKGVRSSIYTGHSNFAGKRLAPTPYTSMVQLNLDGTRTQRQGLVWAADSRLLWPNGVVRYEIEKSHFTDDQQAFIRSEMTAIELQTNITFLPHDHVRHGQINDPQDGNLVRIVKHNSTGSCGSSAIGMVGGVQLLELRPDCIGRGKRTVQHELLHALGVYHEHVRPDRNMHVTFHRENLDGSLEEHNFTKLENVPYWGPYDYESIMHYRSDSGAKKGTKTLSCVSDCNGKTMGGTILSNSDLDGLLAMYPGFYSAIGGREWGDKISTTDIAVGDINGDRQPEVVVVRDAKKQGLARIQIYEPWNNWQPMRGQWDDGRGWGDGAYATSVSLGNIDDDPELELVIGRKQSVNMRAIIFDYKNSDPAKDLEKGKLEVKQKIGEGWAKQYHVRQVMFYNFEQGFLGDDHKDELVIVSNAKNRGQPAEESARRPDSLMVYKLSRQDNTFEQTAHARGAFPGIGINRVAVGNLDGKGEHEFVIATDSTKQGQVRYAFLRLLRHMFAGSTQRLRNFSDGGHGWGDTAMATDIAITSGPDFDGMVPQVAISRRASINNRVFLYHYDAFEDEMQNHGVIGANWLDREWVNRLAFMDFDRDGDEDLLLAKAYPTLTKKRRLTLMRRTNSGGYTESLSEFYPLHSDQKITALVPADVDGNEELELVIGNSYDNKFILSGSGGLGGNDRNDADGPIIQNPFAKRFAVVN
ncbi:M12 family metallopeptidase [Polycladidibacter stylochi]|uniref:M12 family metallopeptidase n=1 Tax=Polycladidibacter stylochi TaxID=1807766 RepID=UPI00138F5ADF|nr:M12 family metallopeptidase [Pseudovibrio stylochi]